jgi:hypothetical protein
MTMDEILGLLLSKAVLEAEEAQRQLLAALNGLAGLALLEERRADAVGWGGGQPAARGWRCRGGVWSRVLAARLPASQPAGRQAWVWCARRQAGPP